MPVEPWQREHSDVRRLRARREVEVGVVIHGHGLSTKVANKTTVRRRLNMRTIAMGRTANSSDMIPDRCTASATMYEPYALRICSAQPGHTRTSAPSMDCSQAGQQWATHEHAELERRVLVQVGVLVQQRRQHAPAHAQNDGHDLETHTTRAQSGWLNHQWIQGNVRPAARSGREWCRKWHHRTGSRPAH